MDDPILPAYDRNVEMDICPKTWTGNHIWDYKYRNANAQNLIDRKETYVDKDNIIKVPIFLRCFACGVIDDR